jgi:hypothetical protein
MLPSAAETAVLADPLEVFEARCAVRAYLWSEGELDLHETVDKLQADAVRDGLVARIGQDRVQAIMAAAFRKVRNPYIVEAADRVPEPMPETPKRSVIAEATLSTAKFLVRKGDTDRLRKWLASHSAVERMAIRKHLEATACLH